MRPTNKQNEKLEALNAKWREHKFNELTLKSAALAQVEMRLKTSRESCYELICELVSLDTPKTRIAAAMNMKGTVLIYEVIDTHKDLIDTILSTTPESIYSWVWGHWDDYDGTVSGTYYPSLRTVSSSTGQPSNSAYQIEDRWLLADSTGDTFDVTVSGNGIMAISADSAIAPMTRGERRAKPVTDRDAAEQWVTDNPKPTGGKPDGF
jgi:hypothetical protein